MDDEVQFAVADELKDYMTANFLSIGKAKVTVEESNHPEDWIVTTDTWTEEMHIVSSLRLDVVTAALVNIPRQKAASLIHGGKSESELGCYVISPHLNFKNQI